MGCECLKIRCLIKNKRCRAAKWVIHVCLFSDMSKSSKAASKASTSDSTEMASGTVRAFSMPWRRTTPPHSTPHTCVRFYTIRNLVEWCEDGTTGGNVRTKKGMQWCITITSLLLIVYRILTHNWAEPLSVNATTSDRFQFSRIILASTAIQIPWIKYK